MAECFCCELLLLLKDAKSVTKENKGIKETLEMYFVTLSYSESKGY